MQILNDLDEAEKSKVNVYWQDTKCLDYLPITKPKSVWFFLMHDLAYHYDAWNNHTMFELDIKIYQNTQLWVLQVSMLWWPWNVAKVTDKGNGINGASWMSTTNEYHPGKIDVYHK